jgi:3-(3-hydroxy-phenyl)propionate hydroxylase
MHPQVDVDVAVVGYGPVGVSAANLLGRYGIRTAVYERDRDIYQRARAVTVNDWTLRIFQSAGLDAAVKVDMDESSALTWKTYGGRTVFRLRAGSSDLGQPGSMMIYQPVMEATLRKGVDRYAGTVDVHFGEAVTGLEQDADGVTLTVSDLESGDERTVRARYVLACDGGSSSLRSAVGAKLIGTTHEVNWIVIDAEVRRWWPGSQELTFWADPDRPAVDIPLALGNHRWELPLRDEERKEDFDSEEAVWRLLEPLGVSRDHVRVKQWAFYVHHVRRADRWRVRRVFLAGDAAHLMPPWAGQGMQSGVRDVHNLVWKLREVLAGRLGDEVLDTYQQERQPHVALMTETSRKLGLIIAGRNPAFVRARNILGPLLMRLRPVTARLIPNTAPSITVGWLTGAPGRGRAVGRMLPQPPAWDARGRPTVLDDHLGDGFALVGLDLDPRAHVPPDDLPGWDALGARYLTVRSTHGTIAADTDLIDHTGRLGAWFTRHHTRLVAVRPDRFVAAADDTGMAVPTPPAPTPESSAAGTGPVSAGTTAD